MVKKTITKEDIKNFIDVIESITVQINYRDNKFLLKTKSYKNYISIKKEDKAGRAKTSFSFADVLIELSDKDRADTEKEYKESKLKSALQANENLFNIIPDAKEKIAAVFISFVDEVQGELNYILKNDLIQYAQGQGGYLYKPKNTKGMTYGTRLVYKDNLGVVKSTDADGKESLVLPPDDVYSFSTLPNLLQTISDITVEYCREMDIKKPLKGTRGQVTPYFIRQSCALVCYTLLYFGDSLSTYFHQKPLKEKTGVCTQIMRDLHVRTMDLGYEYFKKENKLFEYNKWSMLPEVMLREFSYLAPVSQIKYAGYKSGYLGYMIQCLVEQRAFKQYLEPFGGSGIGITQFPKQDGVDYYISDANYANQCFYKILKAPTKQFNEFLDKLKEVQVKVKKIYDDFAVLMRGFFTRKEREDYYKRWYMDLYSSYNEDNFTIDAFLETCNLESFNPERDTQWYNEFLTFLRLHGGIKKLYETFEIIYDDFGNHFLDEKYLSDYPYTEVEIAVAFVVLHSSLINGVVSKHQSLMSPPKFINMKIDTELLQFRKAYESVNIVPDADFGASAMDLLRDARFNNKETIAYLDSPYLNTLSYSVGFDLEDMLNLADACKKFEGKFIFSCRVNLTPKSRDVRQDKETFIRFMNEWCNDQFKVLFLRQPLTLEKKAVSNKKSTSRKVHFEVPVSTQNKLLTENKYTVDYMFLDSCITLYQDLEIMITNFDFEVPVYEKFLELCSETSKKIRDRELEKVFVKLDMKDVADLVIYEYSK